MLILKMVSGGQTGVDYELAHLIHADVYDYVRGA